MKVKKYAGHIVSTLPWTGFLIKYEDKTIFLRNRQIEASDWVQSTWASYISTLVSRTHRLLYGENSARLVAKLAKHNEANRIMAWANGSKKFQSSSTFLDFENIPKYRSTCWRVWLQDPVQRYIGHKHPAVIEHTPWHLRPHCFGHHSKPWDRYLRTPDTRPISAQ